MLDLRPLIRPDFWFASHPTPLMSQSSRGLLLFFTLMLVAGAIVRLTSRKRDADRYAREVHARIARLLSTMGFLGLIWLFFAVEEITFFQARYWVLIWLAGLIVWIVSTLKYAKKTIPAERARLGEEREKMKYLPRKK